MTLRSARSYRPWACKIFSQPLVAALTGRFDEHLVEVLADSRFDVLQYLKTSRHLRLQERTVLDSASSLALTIILAAVQSRRPLWR